MIILGGWGLQGFQLEPAAGKIRRNFRSQQMKYISHSCIRRMQWSLKVAMSCYFIVCSKPICVVLSTEYPKKFKVFMYSLSIN